MKALLVLLLTLFSLGFEIDTPEFRRERERQEKAWRELMERHYDLLALRAFLAQQIKAVGHVEGVDISKSKVAAGWSIHVGGASCGEWNFGGDPEKAEFTLTWTYDDKRHASGHVGVSKMVALHCVRRAKDKFEFVSATRSEHEYVVLLP